MVQTLDTSCDKIDIGGRRRKVLSKKTVRLKEVFVIEEHGIFFVTGPRDASSTFRISYCKICRKEVPLLTNGHYVNLRFCWGACRFPRDQRLRLKTNGRRILGFLGYSLTKGGVEGNNEKIQMSPLVVRHWERLFAEHWSEDGAGVVDPNLPVLAKVSCQVNVLPTEGSYQLVGTSLISLQREITLWLLGPVLKFWQVA